ncbi:MAG: FRG domain-containing protein [Candidatus Wallbacteria bacterium]|nr:FRG domain-containing protein [Candidatus Wallbacteria bacterium]
MIKTRDIKIGNDFFDAISHPKGCRKLWIYRGNSKRDYNLLPNAFRTNFPKKESEKLSNLVGLLDNPPALEDAISKLRTTEDVKLFQEWKKRACNHLNKNYQSDLNDWELLAIAQHHGLYTRLLDWTENPLVAFYFASCSDPDYEGAVWTLGYASKLNPDECSKKEYYNWHGIRIFAPNPSDKRIFAQQALFTIHDTSISIDLVMKIDDDTKITKVLKNLYGLDRPFILQQYIISKAMKKNILPLLDTWGINHERLFPGTIFDDKTDPELVLITQELTEDYNKHIHSSPLSSGISD